MKIRRSEPLRLNHYSDERFGLFDSFFFKRERKNFGFNRRMFDEDFARLFQSRSGRGNLLDIMTNDIELLQRLLGNLNRNYASHSVDRLISKLAEEIARSLTSYGRAYYFLKDDRVQNETQLYPFSTGVFCFFDVLVQLVPIRIERYGDRECERLSRELRILDAAKVMRFVMPVSITHMLDAQNKILAILDKYQFSATDFHPQATHKNPNPTSHFDFRVWNETRERALYRATRSTGWNGRKYDSLKRSDFFDCHRLIRFRRNQLLLRDGILNQLSGELSRIGKGYNSEFTVKISATNELPSIVKLNELEERLQREEAGFKEIIDYCYCNHPEEL